MFLSLVCLALFFASCSKNREFIQASDTITTESHSFTDYNKIDITSDFKVYLNFSDVTEEIRVEGPENLHDYIIVDKTGDELSIRMKSNTTIKNSNDIKVYITTKLVTEFEASSDSEFILEDKLIANNINVKLTGDSKFTADLEVNNAVIKGTSDSKYNLTGEITSLDAELTGDSELRDYDLNVNNLKIDLTGDSSAELTVNGTIDIKATGESRLNYKGQATIIRQDISGESRITDMN